MHDGLLAGRFAVEGVIGRGGFGSVHSGVDQSTSERVAIKVEPNIAKRPLLLYEARVCKSLVGRKGFPQLRYCGIESRRNVLVMDLLGPSLGRLRSRCGGRLGLKTVLMVGIQLIDRLEALHSEGYLHRDISQANILIGRGGSADTVHLIDFGLCKRYRDPVTQKHIEYREGKALKGTMIFASLGALKGGELSRRDDLEALGYVLMYLLSGSLPWQDLPHTYTKRAKYDAMIRARGSSSLHEMCSELPGGQQEFSEYLSYCQSLGFKDSPDYDYLRGLFTRAMAREGFDHDYVYDWSCLDGSDMTATASESTDLDSSSR